MVKRRLSLLAAMGAVLVISCQPEPGSEQNRAANEVAPRLPPLPVAEPPLGREALLIAAARAASAAAAGIDDTSAQRTLDGKRVEFRIRFGCPAAAAGPERDGAFSVRFDPEDRTLRLRAAPNVAADDPLVAAIAGEAVEAVEGFWIGRPWLLVPACPARSAGERPAPDATATDEDPAPDAPPAETTAPIPAARVGIVEFFTEAVPRTRRRAQRAYEVTKVLEEGEDRSRQGYDLVLSGRLRRLADGRVIACVASSPDAPPGCIISLDVDRVRIERPGDGTMLSEWQNG